MNRYGSDFVAQWTNMVTCPLAAAYGRYGFKSITTFFAFQRVVGHFERKFQVEGDIAQQPLLVFRKLEWLPFHVI